MNDNIDTLLTELRTLIADLGKDGGFISPSVYDTAQVLRLFPPEDAGPAIQWLLAQQKADGGWGAYETPYARDVPTLAAVLALHHFNHFPRAIVARDAGLDFLQRQAPQWIQFPIDALPTAAEMLLPYLIEEALACNLPMNPAAYATIYEIRDRKLKLIGKRPLRSDTPPTHSWEALRRDADSILPDASGSIGLSPAATAAWLRLASAQPDLTEQCTRSKQYLARASASTGLDIPGVVPTIWPLTGFELAYGLYALLITGLLSEPSLQAAIEPVVEELWLMMQRGHGVNFGENFTPDLDDTAIAAAVLRERSYEVDPAVILQFKHGDHFCTYHYELNPSILANAHAIYGLAYTTERYPAAEAFLLERQTVNGSWPADKWHTSWLYTTLEVVLALNPLGYSQQTEKVANVLVQQQKANGGWGSGAYATRGETSYAVLALSTLQQYGLLNPKAENALQRGVQWLAQARNSPHAREERLWLAKELYSIYRLDRIYEVGALISVALEKIKV